MPEIIAKTYIATMSSRLERILKSLKKKKPSLFRELNKKIEKIIKEPELGKPLRNVLKSMRRVQVGSFVLVYEIHGNRVHLMDFEHHDRIYGKYL